MTKEQMFYKALQDVFIGAKIEGEGGFINLMRIKSNYYSQIEDILQKDIDNALRQYSNFREELFDKLYTFFSRYFTESGSIYFNSTPFHNNIYEKVYTDDRDVILFWKTQMLYYVKTDRIFRSMPIEVEGIKFRFDASTIENKKANEKRSLIYELKDMEDDKTIIFSVYYSEKGRKTREDDILKEIKKKHISITEELLEKAFRVFEKQSEVDFFINKNARQFLQEQFKLWSYQYFWDGASYWTQDRVNQLQILKDVAFKIIDFISQFEDELVKIWNKPKFVLNSNYVITLDRIMDTALSENQIPPAPFNKGGISVPHPDKEDVSASPFSKGSNPPTPFSKGGLRGILIKILTHSNIDLQIKEWKELGIVDEDFTVEDIFEDEASNNWEERKNPGLFDKNELKQKGLITTGFHLPYNPDLKERARELRKNMTEPERKIWYEYLRNFKYQVLRQKPLDNYIVDFYCPELKIVIEIDGDTHFTEEGKVYDEERTRILEGYGLKIIRFLNTDIMRNLAGVVQEIEKEIHQIPLTPFSKGGIGGSFNFDEESNPPAPFNKGGLRGICPKYKHLPIDTRYFKELELEILSLFDDLDNQLDGWLIKSENYQALNTILPKFREKVQTIYIDPPYNAKSSEIIYVNEYKHSSWITLMENRLSLARYFLSNSGVFECAIDENEHDNLSKLLTEILPNYEKTCISIVHNPRGIQGNNFSYTHEYTFFLCPSKGVIQHKEIEKDKWEYSNLRNWGGESLRTDAKNCFYPILIKDNRIVGIGEIPDNSYHLSSRVIKKDDDVYEVWPIDSNGIERKWRYAKQSIKEILDYLIIKDFEYEFEIYMPKMTEQYKTVWIDSIYDASIYGSKLLSEMFGKIDFDFPKSLYNVFDCLNSVLQSEKSAIVMDFFAGSGTTAHAVIELNRHDNGKRKYILVELGNHFNNVILPRIKKLCISDNWDNGKSKNGKGISHFIKYYELEQYEDTLRNCKYEDGDLLTIPDRSPYQEYVFLKDEKLLKSIDVDYENNKVNIDLTKLYENIDIPETLSNLMGKWIKKITAETVLFEDGNEINYKDLDYKQIKPLIWW